MEYFIELNGEARGPYTVDQIVALNTNTDTLVWNDTMSDWVPMKAVPELMLARKKMGVGNYIYINYKTMANTAIGISAYCFFMSICFAISGGPVAVVIGVLFLIALILGLIGRYMDSQAKVYERKSEMQKCEHYCVLVKRFSIFSFIAIAVALLLTVLAIAMH